MCRCSFVVVIVLVFFTGLDSVPHELYEGSKCQNSDSSGVCTSVLNCPIALASIKTTGTTGLTRCGFNKQIEIVCCPPETRHVIPTDDRSNFVPTKSKKACKDYTNNLPISLSYHITNGEDADKGEFPHMAALGFWSEPDQVYKFNCGGTLISDRYVVTAAHCIINGDENKLKIVRLGEVQVPATVEQPNPKLDHNVIDITVHQKYLWKEKFNDIAVVKLEKRVAFNDNVRPACLYTKDDDPLKLVVTGWGAIALGGEKSVILQKATLTTVPLRDCNATYQSQTTKNIIRSQLCAADNRTRDRSDACQGDSGGPIQIQSNSSISTLVGITSYGIGCGSRYPGVYTRIHSYLPWIERIVWP